MLLILFTIRKKLKTDEKKKKTERSLVTPSKLGTVHQNPLPWPQSCYDFVETLLKDLQNENLSVNTKKKKKKAEKKKDESVCFAA